MKLEDNKLILEFLGVVSLNNWHDGYKLYKMGLPFVCGIEGNGTYTPKFSTSWDWLMIVIKKIADINDSKKENPPFLTFIRNNYTIFDLSILEDINTVHRKVIEFIKWHNRNEYFKN